MNKLNHIAFIMDGNGRWGKRRNKGRNYGHYAGVKTVKKIVEASIKFKIPIVTFYVFSTENWKRPRQEINFLFKLISSYFKAELSEVINNGIKINIIGEISKLPNKLKLILKETKNKTKKNKKIEVNLALNYGSKMELINTFKKIRLKKINEKNINKNLYTGKHPDPDILIRTGGRKRLSNFMLWQLAYSELYFTEVFWPAFRQIDYWRAIRVWQQRDRRFGQ